MSIETRIQAAITKGKEIASTWAGEFIESAAHGEQLGCKELKLVVLTEWITILEGYNQLNFTDSEVVDPAYSCVTLDEVNLVISKINQIQC